MARAPQDENGKRGQKKRGASGGPTTTTVNKMWLLVLAVLALLLLVLILRPGSSWHVERRLQAAGVMPSSPWRAIL